MTSRRPQNLSAAALSKREIEAAFIGAHWEYGGLIHRKAAEALVAALEAEPSDSATGHALFSRLFGEYAATLETYAAWGWSLQRRSEPGSFLDNYLGYSNSDVGNFYNAVRDHEGDLLDLLRLPSVERVRAAVQARFAAVAPDDAGTASLEAHYRRFKEAAGRYFGSDRLLIDTYNKTKHGAPMIRMFDDQNPRAFEVVMMNRRAAETGEPPFQFAAFTVNRSEITKMLKNVRVMTHAITDLAALTKVLMEAGLLFADPSVYQRNQ